MPGTSSTAPTGQVIYRGGLCSRSVLGERDYPRGAAANPRCPERQSALRRGVTNLCRRVTASDNGSSENSV
jgi:hypothetical protein